MAEDLLSSSFKLLKQNSRQTDGFSYTVPSPQNYPYQWLWDSCFHAIILSYFDLNAAKRELFSLISQQFNSGLIPHMIYWVPGKKHRIDWGKTNTSSITQPPIIADAALKIYQTDQDIQFLKSIYPALKKFYLYLLHDRDTRGNHLIGLINPDESGEDNSPRFDIPLKAPTMLSSEGHLKLRLKLVKKNKTCHFDAPKCMKNFFWVKDVPFNAIMVKNLNSLSLLAKALAKKEDETYFKKQARLICQAMKKYMSDDEVYWSVYQPDYKQQVTNYKKIRVKTWAIFAPLYAKMISQHEAEHLVDEHLLNKHEFWLKYPVPTVSFDEPSFNPEGFWRGQTWIAINWFIFHGLLNYGFDYIAREVYQISKYLITKYGFREHFNPLTGKGLGAKNFTWGTLVVDMEKTLRSK